jgi:ABC-type sugar transport system permease subunit
MTVIWSFRRFAMTWLLTKGGPAQATETVVVTDIQQCLYQQ